MTDDTQIGQDYMCHYECAQTGLITDHTRNNFTKCSAHYTENTSKILCAFWLLKGC